MTIKHRASRPEKLMRLASRLLSVLLLSAAPLALADDAGSDQTRIEFNIPVQTVPTALSEFARQARVQLFFISDGYEDVRANALFGTYTRQEALDLLLNGTGLKASISPDSGIEVKPVSSTMSLRSDESRLSAAVREVAVADGADGSRNLGRLQAEWVREADNVGDAAETEKRPIEEIVVTGTNIRGISSIASPIQSFEREEIERSGFATTEQFIQALSINFTGGASETTVEAISGGTPGLGNTGVGTGINLRGLGNVATLTLINGRRTVSSNQGETVDLSLIPVSAVERIEIMGDGGSAIYGTDAVGGVVNIILRDDYEGVETRVRHGRATQGGLEEYRVGQTFGTTWTSGNAQASFEWFSRGNLDANDRPFSEGTTDPFDLLPSRRQHTVLASAKQALSDRTEISGFATYAARDTDRFLSNPAAKVQLSAEVEQYNASLALEHQFNSSWVAELSAVYGATETNRTQLRDDALSDVFQKPKLLTVDLKSDGALFASPGGVAKLAIGGQYRRDEFSFSATRTGRSGAFDRDVAAAFVEVYIPLVSEQNQIPGVRELEITAAGRFEHYSDFGSTANPKVGVRWSPVDGLSFRGTWGKSFRAPLLVELDDSDEQTVGFDLFLFPDPKSPTGSSGLVWTSGGNRDLGPERAETWSVGFDATDFLIPNLSINATYIGLTFTDRIGSSLQGISVLDTFLLEDQLGSLFTRVDDPLARAELFSTIDVNVGLTVDRVGGFLDARNHNLSNVGESAIDFGIGYFVNSGFGDFTFDFSGTYIRKLEAQLTNTAAFVSKVDTIFDPSDLRFRAGTSWSRNGVTLSGFVNYVDDYTNDTSGDEVPVNSWTTVDLAAALQIGEPVPAVGVFSNLALQVSVINLFDKDPPFVEVPSTPTFPVNFDGANANPNGRIVAVELVKRW